MSAVCKHGKHFTNKCDLCWDDDLMRGVKEIMQPNRLIKNRLKDAMEKRKSKKRNKFKNVVI